MTELAAVEQAAGDCLVAPLDGKGVDHQRERAFTSYERHLIAAAHTLDETRSARWNRDFSSIAAYETSVASMRDALVSLLGFWTAPSDRAELEVGEGEILTEQEDFVALRRWVRILPDLEVYWVELIPKTTPPPHAALIVQHGYLGTPEAACGLVKSANDADYSYRSLGLRAVKRGYHVIAPHHPSGFGSADETITEPLPTHPGLGIHYGKNRLNRLSMLAGGTVLGLDLLVTSRAIDYLLISGTVQADKIGMYGLSRGGMCTLWLAAIDHRISASVSSAHFNTRLRKLLGPQRGIAFVDWYAEWVFFRGQLELFGDSDIASLIIPRAFAIEAGINDASVDVETVIPEFERLRAHYAALGLGPKCELILHEEGHISATREAFSFLDKHLGQSLDPNEPTP